MSPQETTHHESKNNQRGMTFGTDMALFGDSVS